MRKILDGIYDAALFTTIFGLIIYMISLMIGAGA